MDEKQLTVLRRKFLVGIPTFGIVGYLGARAAAIGLGLSKWPTRGLKILGGIGGPLLGSMLIVHFNKAQIFRVGNSMMRQMEELRKLEEGPFADPAVRRKWDEQIANRKYTGLFNPDVNIADEYQSGVDYNRLVEDSIRK